MRVGSTNISPNIGYSGRKEELHPYVPMCIIVAVKAAALNIYIVAHFA